MFPHPPLLSIALIHSQLLRGMHLTDTYLLVRDGSRRSPEAQAVGATYSSGVESSGPTLLPPPCLVSHKYRLVKAISKRRCARLSPVLFRSTAFEAIQIDQGRA
ncbi:hypothetical protein C8Q77DRAFT_1088113 [Trametes polyzona]|nr:hypothetical protein C8Q77DRAFT_1088113 [Trametes polyzona]